MTWSIGLQVLAWCMVIITFSGMSYACAKELVSRHLLDIVPNTLFK